MAKLSFGLAADGLSGMLQDQDFEEKVAMLRNEFPQVDADQIQHCLETAQGNPDVAFSMLLEDADYLLQQVSWEYT